VSPIVAVPEDPATLNPALTTSTYGNVTGLLERKWICIPRRSEFRHACGAAREILFQAQVAFARDLPAVWIRENVYHPCLPEERPSVRGAATIPLQVASIPNHGGERDARAIYLC